MLTLTDRDKAQIAAMQKDCKLIEVSVQVDQYGFWEIRGTHNGEVKIQARGKIWTPTKNEFRVAYYAAEQAGLLK